MLRILTLNFLHLQPLYYPDGSTDGQKLNVEEKKARMRNENSNNIDRNDRDRNDRGMGRAISGGQRSGDRDRGMGGLNRTSNSRPGGGNRPFNRNDRQQGGPRGSNNAPNSAAAGNGGYGRR